MVSTAAFDGRVRSSVPGLGGWKDTKIFLPHPRVKVCIVGSLRDREVACSASDRQGSNFESCVWRTVSSQSSHHPQEVLLAQFILSVHKGGLKPDSCHFFYFTAGTCGCEAEWLLYEENCYLFAEKNDKRHFSDAQQICQSYGADLVSISSKDENDFVYNNR